MSGWGLAAAFLISGLVAGVGARRGVLSNSGFAGGTLIGTAILGFGGWRWAFLLGLFFVSSSLLSRFQEERKRGVAEKFDKGSRRDWGQTMANGGVAAGAAAAAWWLPAPVWLPIFVGALATVTADTWATELGTLSSQPPRLVTSGRRVPPGTSGGVTAAGSASAAAGALAIGLAAGWLFPTLPFWQGALIGGLAGLFGSYVDSGLGGTIQAIYTCEICGEETERRIHHGRPARRRRGWSWLTNDWVNFLASLAGGGAAALIWIFLS